MRTQHVHSLTDFFLSSYHHQLAPWCVVPLVCGLLVGESRFMATIGPTLSPAAARVPGEAHDSGVCQTHMMCNTLRRDYYREAMVDFLGGGVTARQRDSQGR